MNRGGVGWGGVGQGGAGRQRSQTRGGLLLFRSLALVGAAFFGRERWSEGGTSVGKAPSDNRARQPGLSTADACPVVPFDDKKKKLSRPVAVFRCFSCMFCLFTWGVLRARTVLPLPSPCFFFVFLLVCFLVLPLFVFSALCSLLVLFVFCSWFFSFPPHPSCMPHVVVTNASIPCLACSPPSPASTPTLAGMFCRCRCIWLGGRKTSPKSSSGDR